MPKDTHVTAPTRLVEANGFRYAYRRFGSQSGTPLVFLQRFRGGLDNWDPLVTDGLAQGRPVILFNNAGVASSSGETPNSIDAMGDHLAAFVNALRLPEMDVLGGVANTDPCCRRSCGNSQVADSISPSRELQL
jgi:pimeloyl-ACP methyl ester carboxylesterase